MALLPSTGGIGAEIIVKLAKHSPDRIIFTGRNAKAADKTIQRIKAVGPGISAIFVICDLASLATVRDAANKILAESNPLDMFVANAGIIAQPAGLPADGYKVHFATNHLDHALLTKKLLPLLEQTAGLPDSDVCNSKLANMLYARELAQRRPKTTYFQPPPRCGRDRPGKQSQARRSNLRPCFDDGQDDLT
ncbi:hypothetical protein F5Y03DRAFT_395234 [Xylaria venustula]|nr:hypothetical protein F5Y03DRAFT_395234 [Xylaria venustula]